MRWIDITGQGLKEHNGCPGRGLDGVYDLGLPMGEDALFAEGALSGGNQTREYSDHRFDHLSRKSKEKKLLNKINQ